MSEDGFFQLFPSGLSWPRSNLERGLFLYDLIDVSGILCTVLRICQISDNC